MKLFSKALVSFCYHKARVYSHQEVVEMYRGPKYRIYQKAFETFLNEGCRDVHSLLNTFIKFEKTNLDKAPRIINPRHPVYNLCVARYLKKLEKIAYKAINRVFGERTSHTVIKGLNIVDSANVIKSKWDLFTEPVGIGGDITKLDMHIDVPHLEYEHSIYNRIFRSRSLKQKLKKQLRNRGTAYFADGKVKFEMKGKRSSGDINTSLGNVIIVCSVLYDFKQSYGLNMELINNGDDFVIICERSDLSVVVDNLPSHFKMFGFRLTTEKPVFELDELEFCQTKPVFDGKFWRMCRIPQTLFQKDTICTVPIQNSKVLRKWYNAVGKCGLALTRGLPVLQSFYKAYLRSGLESSDKFVHHIYKNTGMSERLSDLNTFSDDITEEARVSFATAFKILPDMQRDLERYFDSLVLSDEITTITGNIRDSNLIHNEIQL